MATAVEILDGNELSRDSSGGSLSDTVSRSFRIVRGSLNETVDLQQACGIYNGDAHPTIPGLICQSFSGRFENGSRMVILATFAYSTLPTTSLQPPQGGQAPDARPPNWTVSTSTYESPVWSWKKVTSGSAGSSVAAANPVGDLYDGISRLEPIINIAIEQYQANDPLVHSAVVGKINSSPVKVGAYTFPACTMMLRGIDMAPHVEAYGPNGVWRGWKATYQFSCKSNPALIHTGSVGNTESIGWDIAVPQTGFNVKAFDPANPGQDDEPYCQPLKHDDKGKIKTGPLELPDEVTASDKVRAMVKIFSYKGGGASQTPSAQPIPLNDSGRPRKESASPKVLVYRYRVYEEYDFNQLGIRLQ